MKYYVINLDHSLNRWNAIKADLNMLAIEPTRIPAIYGKNVNKQNWMPDFDASKFRFNHGVEALPGEYGCYASHLAALDICLDEERH
jgi:glycosyl transferase, family 25